MYSNSNPFNIDVECINRCRTYCRLSIAMNELWMCHCKLIDSFCCVFIPCDLFKFIEFLALNSADVIELCNGKSYKRSLNH